MAQRKARGTKDDPAEQALRDQEVLRANRELAAYFKGQRTEREARAALKIIKAYVRGRERLDAADRPPLPGRSAAPAKDGVKRKAAAERGNRRRPKLRRAAHGSKRLAAVLPMQDTSESPPAPSSDSHTSE